MSLGRHADKLHFHQTLLIERIYIYIYIYRAPPQLARLYPLHSVPDFSVGKCLGGADAIYSKAKKFFRSTSKSAAAQPFILSRKRPSSVPISRYPESGLALFKTASVANMLRPSARTYPLIGSSGIAKFRLAETEPIAQCARSVLTGRLLPSPSAPTTQVMISDDARQKCRSHRFSYRFC